MKNFPDLRVSNIVNLICYEGPGPRLCFVDQKGLTSVISLDIGLILTKVKIEEIFHKMERVDTCDIIRIKEKTSLLAIGGAGCFQVVKIEPEL